jgi:hypothetical protein
MRSSQVNNSDMSLFWDVQKSAFRADYFILLLLQKRTHLRTKYGFFSAVRCFPYCHFFLNDV